MQSTSMFKRILAMALCLALALSCLPGISFGASASETTATDATEAASDLLSSNLAYNKTQWDNYEGTDTGLTAEKNSVCVNGSESASSWEFKASASAASSAVAQIHLTDITDLSNHYLMMDVKYVTAGAEESVSFNARLHNSSWADVNTAQSITVSAGDWQTVTLLPSQTVISGKDMSDCKLLTFNFDFSGTSGAERAIYIDNVRAVKIETAKEDWIKLPIDSGMSNCTYEVVTGLSVSDSSTQSLKLYTTTETGSICFHTQEGVNQGALDAYPNMTSGILSGWFYFGGATPSANVTLTYSDWGVSNTVDFAFEAKGNGWYYGTVDCASFTTTSGSEGSTSAVWRVDIANLPKASTMYIDCLTHTQKAIDGLSIAYPYNTETYQQTATPVSRFSALTFNSARYEVESAQMILTPSFEVTNFELVMGNLVNDNGNVISGTDFDVFVQHYVTAEGSKNGGAQATNPDTGEVVWNAEDHLTAGVDGVFPNALVPQDAYIAKGENVIASGNNQGIWVNLNVDDAAPGTYTGVATLIVNGSNMQIPVSVTVYDVALPEEVHVESSFQIWWDLLEAGEGTISASMARAYEEYLVSKRIMPMDAWNITRYDNTFVEYAVEWAQDPAISSYAISYGEPVDGALNSEAITATLTAIINKNLELAAAGSDVDLFEKAYFYFGKICDEPRNDEDYAIVNTCTATLEAIKEELAPMLADYPALQNSFMNLKHLVTGPDPADKTYAFLSAQDYGSTALTGESYIYVPQYQWLNTEEQRALYADEEEIWWYGCNHPVNPYPSYSFNSPLITSRALGWMMYDYDIDGILYWCVNSWGSYDNGIQLKDYWGTYTSSTPGEGILILPGVDYGVNGPIGTIRIESIREAHEDYEYLWLLEQFTGSDAAAATYTAGMYEGSIPSTDVTIHHNNRIALLEKLEELNIAANGATVIEPDLPVMPTDPQPEPEVIVYPVDIIAIGTCAKAAEQTDVVNGDDTAWKITYTAENDWVYPEIVLDKAYDISNHMLVMDVKVTGMTECRMQLASIDGNWSAGSASAYLTNLEGWNSMTYDLSANGAGLTEMTKFSLGIDVPSGTDYAIYIDNIYLVPLETVENDWIHLTQDTGSYYKNTTTSFSGSMLKAENSGLSMKVVAPADAEGKFTFNTEYAVTLGQLTAKPDFTSGTLGAWFYFGDAEPSVGVTVTASNWKGSARTGLSFVYGGNGWYYGTLDTSTITFYEDASLEGIIRLTFILPAGYSGYVDGITFPGVEEVTPIIREDMSADWTNLPASSSDAELTLGEDFCYSEGSSQSLKVVTGENDAAVVINVSSVAPDMTSGTLGAWFYFGDAEPSATLYVVDDEGYDSSMHIDGPVAFTFGEGVDGWYYGTVDCASIVFDEMDIDSGAGSDAIAELYITVPANSTLYIDCLTLDSGEEEEPDVTEPTEPEETEPVASDPDDLLANATAADTVGILGGGNFSYDSASAVVCGDSSTKSWMFAGNTSASGWPTALLNLGQSYDMSGKVLAFNVKTDGARGYVGVSQLYNSGWASLCASDQANYTTTFTAGQWTTVYFDLDSKVGEGKDLTDVQFIRFIFDFDTNTGSEQKVYIDNVRLLDNYETVENDWIHMDIDSGDSTADIILDMDHVKAENSSLSMKVVSGEADSTWVLNPVLEYGAGIDLTSGILGGYFYFGDVEPSVKVRLTDSSWAGGVTLSMTMTDAGDGWYYGSIDVSTLYFYEDQIANGASREEIIRIKLTFPANSTVYVDGLTLTAELEGDDLLTDATIAVGTLQNAETNGSDVAWMLVPTLGTEHNWSYPSFVLAQEYSISSHKLVMDVKPVNMTSCQINLSTINSEWLSGVTSQTLTVGQWNTVEFALSGTTMSEFGLGMEIIGGDNYAVYIDNVKLVRVETVDEDLLNLGVDAGESTAGTYEKIDSFTKDDNSGLAVKLTPTADAAAKISLSVNNTLGDNYDMSTGVLGAWFYFGDQTPSASVNFSGNWKASVPQNFSFGEGVDGWYYGEVDMSAVTFYEEVGTTTDVERIRITVPAGYEAVYVDYLTYDPDAATVTTETESDMLYGAQFAYNSANWTTENGTSYGIDNSVVNGAASMQSWAFKASASASLSPVAQFALSQSYDATGKVLMFDVKANVATDIKIRFHNTGWSDITADKTIGVTAGDWATYVLDPSSLVVEGKDLTDLKMITFTFNFVANTGSEREIYIDNVRLVTPETAEQDWINLTQDKGSWYSNSNAYLTDEKVKAEGSTVSLKATSPADTDGKFTFNISDLNMTNGTLGAWFYFGDAEPKARVQFTGGNWKGSVSASFTFGEGEDGWYYGTLDTSSVSFYDENSDGVPDDDLSAVVRLMILFAADSTIYVDGLSYTANECVHTNTTTTTVDATCTEAGSTTVVCDDCGEAVSQETIPATGHSYVSGTCSVCGTADPDYVVVLPGGTATLKFSGATLKLEADLTMNVLVHSNVFADGNYTNGRVEISMTDAKTGITNTVIYTDNYNVNGNYREYVFTGISPRKMNDTITLTVYGTYAGVEYSKTMTYSVATYAYNKLKTSTDTKFLTLLADLLNFGSAHQVYTGYNTDNLVNANMTDTQKGYASTGDLTLTNKLNAKYEVLEGATASFRGASLVLTEKVEIQYIVVVSDLTDVSLKVTADGVTYTVDSSEFVAYGSTAGWYTVNVSFLQAKQMRSDVTAAVYCGDTAISNTALYSVESYAASKINGTDANLVALLKMMMYYGDSAAAYFA